MNYFESTQITGLATHYVGNKNNEEELLLSQRVISLNEQLKQVLHTYFLSSFKEGQYYQFNIEGEQESNTVHQLVTQIFDHPEQLHEHSVAIAQHLYEQGVHPKIKGGELYVAYLKECVVDGEVCDAVGIFKSEHKDLFLTIFEQEGSLAIETEEGININKLDKGCLIFNIDPENGYTVSVVDQTNRGSESKFWTNLFLNLKPKEDLYFYTQQALTLCKDFINQELPEQIEINRAQQVDLLQRSVEYFKENDQFEQEQFKEQVLVEPEVIQSFEQFQEQRVEDNQSLPLKQFEISEKAVKRETKYIRSVIKLDKNFHIYVHGDRKLIEQGNEADGRKYYKLYFEEEK